MLRLRRLAGSTRQPSTIAATLRDLAPAPALLGVQPWINTPDGEPLTLGGLMGGVVLIEFWAFACSNCACTVPFLAHMHARYPGTLTVVGVHTRAAIRAGRRQRGARGPPASALVPGRAR